MNTFQIIAESINITHPLDNKTQSNFGFDIPENNYHREVMHELHRIFEDENRISEKDFARQDQLKVRCEKIIRNPKVGTIIQRFKDRALRPSYCAECIYSKIKK